MSEPSLSDHRGNHAGILFFRIFLKIFGLNHAANMVWIVTFFYAVFDRQAGKRLNPYLKHRFPDDRGLMHFFHTWAVFAHQGIAILLAEAFRHNMAVCSTVYGSPEIEKIMTSPVPAVLLHSHLGPWQLAMLKSRDSVCKVNALIRQDVNPNVDKMKGAEQLNPVYSGDVSGGLIDLSEALERGEVAAMMGDRCLESNPLQIDFLGEKASFPAAAFYLAARHHVPLILAFMEHCPGTRLEYRLNFSRLLYPEMKCRDRSDLFSFAEIYVNDLEERCRKYPFDCFLFEDVWSGRK